MVVGFGFAGMAIGVSTFLRSWQDFDTVQLVQLPMFLFSATFYPLSVYPAAIQWFVRVSPLYHATQLLRALNFGTVGWPQALDLAYLLALGLLGVFVAQRRLGRALLR